MRLSETHPSLHSRIGTERTARRAFTGRHAVLLGLLIGVGVLLRADTALPVDVRIPGLLILLGVISYLLVGQFRTRGERRR